MAEHFADRLAAAIERKNAPVCVGLDPVVERLPMAVNGKESVGRLRAFCVGVVDAVAEHVPVMKVQAACFEKFGPAGWAVLEHVIGEVKARGLLVILDAKRGDIGLSSEHYAVGLLGQLGADALTVNPYLGMDALEPFIRHAAEQGKGLFALVRTSNPGSDTLQGLALGDGRTMAEAVADQLAQVGNPHLGKCGYSSVGAVVGATKPDEIASLRQRMPKQLFLVPGFGAQGGKSDDVCPCFHHDGTGALVSASRSVIYAGQSTDTDWTAAVEAAAKRFKAQVNAAILGRA